MDPRAEIVIETGSKSTLKEDEGPKIERYILDLNVREYVYFRPHRTPKRRSLQMWRGVDDVMPENPHVKWHTARRGYMVCDIKPDSWTTDYREVAYISRAGAPVTTPTRWLVEHGKPGVKRL